jgi:5,10-methenyltetrahydrofolate synthetase
MDLAAWRREVRAQQIEARQRLSPEEHVRASKAIEGLLEEILADLPPQTLSAFWPFKGEVDLRPLMERLQAKGWITALPSVVRRGMPLEFLLWTSGAEMDAGVYGIPFPRVRELVIPDIIVMPLVAFDSANYRLGYGAGYFDITLASRNPRPRSIGVGFEMCRIETIHPVPTDIPLDLVITEAGIQRIEAEKRF